MMAGALAFRLSDFGVKRVPNDVHLVLVFERDLLQVHLVAGVEVVCAVGHVLSLCNGYVDERHHAERGHSRDREPERVATAEIDAVAFRMMRAKCGLHDPVSPCLDGLSARDLGTALISIMKIGRSRIHRVVAIVYLWL